MVSVAPVAPRARTRFVTFRTGLAAIAAVGFVARVIYLFTLSPAIAGIGDSAYYYYTSNLIVQGQGYTEPFNADVLQPAHAHGVASAAVAGGARGAVAVHGSCDRRRSARRLGARAPSSPRLCGRRPRGGPRGAARKAHRRTARRAGGGRAGGAVSALPDTRRVALQRDSVRGGRGDLAVDGVPVRRPPDAGARAVARSARRTRGPDA